MKHFLAAVALLVLGGCGTISNPFAVAETTDQQVYAVTAAYNIALESARDIVVDETLPLKLRRTVQRVEAQTTPVIDELDAVYAEFVVERAKFEAGQTTEERLDIVAENLELWVTKAEEALMRLSAVVDGD